MPYEIAYLAGLFEGEGTVNVQRNYTHRDGSRRPRITPQLSIRIGMTDREPLDRCQAWFGGRVYGPYGPYLNDGKIKPA